MAAPRLPPAFIFCTPNDPRPVQHGVGVELDAVLPVDQTVSASR